jgi:hypothetical protein
MKSNLVKKIAGGQEDLILVKNETADAKTVNDAPPAVISSRESKWVKDIEGRMPPTLLMRINAYMVGLKGMFHDTADSFNDVSMMIMGAMDDPSMRDVLAYLRQLNIHPQSYLLTRFCVSNPEADKYFGINTIKEETAGNITAIETASPEKPVSDTGKKEDITPPPAFGEGMLTGLFRQVREFFGKPFHLNLDFMSLADGQANVMDLETLLSKETVGRISPHASGFFNEEMLLPTLKGGRKLSPSEGRSSRRTIPNINSADIALQPGEIEVELPLGFSSAIPLPNNYEIVAVVGDKPLDVHEPDGRRPCITSISRPFLKKKLHFIIKQRTTSPAVDFGGYKSSEEEVKGFKESLPLPDEITEQASRGIKDAMKALGDFFRGNFLYVCDPRLGKFIGSHHDELATVTEALKVGHCSILSWAAAIYLRQLGYDAMIVNSRCTNDEGSAFRLAGHARVALKDDDGSLLFFDPTFHCKTAEGLVLSNIPDKAFTELEKKYSRSKSLEEKKRILSEFKEEYIDVSSHGRVPPDAGQPPDILEIESEKAKLLQLIQKARPEYSLSSPEFYDDRADGQQRLDIMRNARKRLTAISELLKNPLNSSVLTDCVYKRDPSFPHDTLAFNQGPLTFNLYENSRTQSLVKDRDSSGYYIRPLSDGALFYSYDRYISEPIYFKFIKPDKPQASGEKATTRLYNQKNILFACKNAMLLPEIHGRKKQADTCFLDHREDKWKSLFAGGKFDILKADEEDASASQKIRFLSWLGLALAIKVNGLKQPGKYESHEDYEWAQSYAVNNLLKFLVESGMNPSLEEAEIRLNEILLEFARFLQPYPWSGRERKVVEGLQGRKQALIGLAKEYGVGRIKKRFQLIDSQKDPLLIVFRSFLSKMSLKDEPLSFDESDREYAEYDPGRHDAADIDMTATNRAGKYMAKIKRLKPEPKKLHVIFDADIIHPNSSDFFYLYGKFRVALEGLAQYARVRKVKVYVTSSSLDYLELDPAWTDDQLDLIAMWLCKGKHGGGHPPGINTAKGMPKNILLISGSDGSVNSFKYALKGKTNLFTTDLSIYPYLKDVDAPGDKRD